MGPSEVRGHSSVGAEADGAAWGRGTPWEQFWVLPWMLELKTLNINLFHLDPKKQSWGVWGDDSFPDWIYWHLGNCFTCYFSVCHDKRPCYKRYRMQSLDHVEVKIFLCEDFTPVLTVPLQRGTSKLFTRRKVESSVHQWTHLIFQVTAHRNSEFRFLSDVIHSQL